jgi:hypothetical protein
MIQRRSHALQLAYRLPLMVGFHVIMPWKCTKTESAIVRRQTDSYGAGLLRVLATSHLVGVGIDPVMFHLPIYGHAISMSPFTLGVVLLMISAASAVARIAIPGLLAELSEEKAVDNVVLKTNIEELIRSRMRLQNVMSGSI